MSIGVEVDVQPDVFT